VGVLFSNRGISAMDSSLERQLQRYLAGLAASGVEFVRVAKAPPADMFVSASTDSQPSPTAERTPLQTLAPEYDACTRCTGIASTRIGTVPGSGPVGAKLFVLGDAPRADDVKAQEPFTGAVGETLTKMLKAIGIEREDAYISTALRCRPPGDRKPSAKEIGNCRAFLERELRIVEPKFVLCLGEAAGQSLLQEEDSLSNLRAKVHDLRGTKVVCTHHPKDFGTNPGAKSEAWSDLQLLMKTMKSSDN